MIDRGGRKAAGSGPGSMVPLTDTPFQSLKLYMTEKEVSDLVNTLAVRVDRHLTQAIGPNAPIDVVILLQAGFVFGADFIRYLHRPIRVNLARPGYVRSALRFGNEGHRPVLILDTICDRGDTLAQVVKDIKAWQPNIYTCTLLMRYSSFFAPHFVGHTVNTDYWLVGYGLDSDERGGNGLYRNLPNLRYKAKE